MTNLCDEGVHLVLKGGHLVLVPDARGQFRGGHLVLLRRREKNIARVSLALQACNSGCTQGYHQDAFALLVPGCLRNLEQVVNILHVGCKKVNNFIGLATSCPNKSDIQL